MIRLFTFFLFALVYLGLSGAVYADKQEELENLRSRIASVQREIEKTSESRSEAADNLRQSERAISDAHRKLENLAKLRKSADTRLAELQSKEQALDKRILEQQELLGKLLYQQYIGGKQEHFRLLLSGRNPNEIARDLEYYRYIASYRSAWLSSLHNDLIDLGGVSANLREKHAELAALLSEQSLQKGKLETEKRSRKILLSKISRQLRLQRREIKTLQRNENHLAQLVEKISAMLSQPKSGSFFRNDRLPDNRFDGNPFDNLKGKLTLPVKGTVTNRFNTPRPDSTILWKGLFLRTSSGQPVKAVAAGQIVFADWLRGFGNLIIIDHGNNYMSLYANNETLFKQVGDILSGGDTIAAVGNSGGNEDFGLYFELRHKSKPLDPMQWLATK